MVHEVAEGTLQGQGFGGESVGGFEGAGVFRQPFLKPRRDFRW